MRVYRQDLLNEDPPPEGDGWDAFAANTQVKHNGLRESLGGRYEVILNVVWWKALGDDVSAPNEVINA